MLKHSIYISACVVACVRVLKVSLRTESGFKINRALCGIKSCCALMWRPEEAGCLSVKPPSSPLPSHPHSATLLA